MRTIVMVASAVVVVAAAAVLGLYLWLRTYAPLASPPPFTPGPGLGSFVQPTFGSGGKPVLIPAHRAGRPFSTEITLENDGRFAVTVTGVESAGGPLAAAALTPATVRLDANDSALVTVRWSLDCRHAPDQVSSDRVRLRYRYLSLFRRTEAVVLPFAVTLRCSGGPPASP